jgi:initiation factor 1A
MVKNTKGGAGHKKQKNKPTGGQGKLKTVAELAKSEDPNSGEVYGRVTAALGDKRMRVYCQDPSGEDGYKTMVCHIRGAVRTRICIDDYVLVQLHSSDFKKGEILYAYSNDDVECLISANLWDMKKCKQASSVKMPNESDDSDSESEHDDIDNDSEVEMETEEKNIDVI